jgi:predicted tellurium resistance membrane protein TerC
MPAPSGRWRHPGRQREPPAARLLLGNDELRFGMDTRAILGAIVAIAFTDIALQLDNALAISTVASQLPASQRLPVLAGGVLLAATCLLAFTLVGATLVEKVTWLKPVAGVVLVGIGLQLVWSFFKH